MEYYPFKSDFGREEHYQQSTRSNGWCVPSYSLKMGNKFNSATSRHAY